MLGIDAKDCPKVLMTQYGVARRIGLDEVGEIALQILEHVGGWVVGIRDKAEIDYVVCPFVTHQVGQRWGVGSLVEEMPPEFRRGGGGSECLSHLLPTSII